MKTTLNCYPTDKIKLRNIVGNLGLVEPKDTEADLLKKLLNFCEGKKKNVGKANA